MLLDGIYKENKGMTIIFPLYNKSISISFSALFLYASLIVVELQNFLRKDPWIHFCVIFIFITEYKRRLKENFKS